MEKIKTPEEILVEKYGCSDLADLQKCFLNDMISFSMIVESMQEYGKQRHNEAINIATQKIIEFYGSKGLTNTGNRIKEEILKLLEL